MHRSTLNRLPEKKFKDIVDLIINDVKTNKLLTLNYYKNVKRKRKDKRFS